MEITKTDPTEEKIIDGYDNVCCSPIIISLSQFLTLSKMLGFLEGSITNLEVIDRWADLVEPSELYDFLVKHRDALKHMLKDELEPIVMALRDQLELEGKKLEII
jgi:hypothetical protein